MQAKLSSPYYRREVPAHAVSFPRLSTASYSILSARYVTLRHVTPGTSRQRDAAGRCRRQRAFPAALAHRTPVGYPTPPGTASSMPRCCSLRRPAPGNRQQQQQQQTIDWSQRRAEPPTVGPLSSRDSTDRVRLDYSNSVRNGSSPWRSPIAEDLHVLLLQKLLLQNLYSAQIQACSNRRRWCRWVVQPSYMYLVRSTLSKTNSLAVLWE